MTNDIANLNAAEIDAIAGGPIQWVAIGGAVLVVAAGAEAAKKIIEVGEKLHDAVCDH